MIKVKRKLGRLMRWIERIDWTKVVFAIFVGFLMLLLIGFLGFASYVTIHDHGWVYYLKSMVAAVVIIGIFIGIGRFKLSWGSIRDYLLYDADHELVRIPKKLGIAIDAVTSEMGVIEIVDQSPYRKSVHVLLPAEAYVNDRTVKAADYINKWVDQPSTLEVTSHDRARLVIRAIDGWIPQEDEE